MIFVIIFVIFVIVKPIVTRLLANSPAGDLGSSFSVQRSGLADTTPPSDWRTVAEALGLRILTRRGTQHMSGTIDGFRVSVEDRAGGAKVEVDYKSPLRDFEIRPISKGRTITNAERILTGNQAFDAVFNAYCYQAEEFRAFLTPPRQETLLALHSALTIDEIDEDEIEVRLPSPCDPSDMIDAIELAIDVARVFSNTAVPQPPTALPVQPQRSAPQDRVISSPQDTIR